MKLCKHCLKEGITAKAVAKEMCMKHFKRYQRTGTVLTKKEMMTEDQVKLCASENCKRKSAIGKEYCSVCNSKHQRLELKAQGICSVCKTNKIAEGRSVYSCHSCLDKNGERLRGKTQIKNANRNVYLDILEGKQKRAADHTWSSRDNLKSCMRFYFLEWKKIDTRQGIIDNTNRKTITDAKLIVAVHTLYPSIFHAVIDSFPEHNIRLWEFPKAPRGTWEEDSNIIDAIRWLTERLGIDSKEKVLALKGIDFTNNHLQSLAKYESLSLAQYMIKALPEYNLRLSDFKRS